MHWTLILSITLAAALAATAGPTGGPAMDDVKEAVARLAAAETGAAEAAAVDALRAALARHGLPVRVEVLAADGAVLDFGAGAAQGVAGPVTVTVYPGPEPWTSAPFTPVDRQNLTALFRE